MSEAAEKYYDLLTSIDDGANYRNPNHQLVERFDRADLIQNILGLEDRESQGNSFAGGASESSTMDFVLNESQTQTKSVESFFLNKLVLPDIEIDRRAKSRPIAVAQEWEGIVTAIHQEEFTARLTDITNPSSPAEEAEFCIQDLGDETRGLLKEGAVFRWIIGYRGGRTGSRMRVSQITFRRLPAWTKSEVAKADQLAEELAEGIDWK